MRRRTRTIRYGALWNAFAAIDAVYNIPSGRRVRSPGIAATHFVTARDEHPLTTSRTHSSQQFRGSFPTRSIPIIRTLKTGQYTGPAWVASVVNAIGQSSYWNSTAIIVVWDDWGGFYDHVPPPFFDNAGGLGFRVPMLVISPYVPAGTIAHTQYEFGSILKFAEQTFGLGSMGTTDVRATSIGNIFNFKQKARQLSR